MEQLDRFEADVDQALDAAAQAVAEAKKARGGFMALDRVAVLAAIGAAQKALEDAQAGTVAYSRFLGDSWGKLAVGLGVTKQAARKRWLDNPGDVAAAKIRACEGVEDPPPSMVGDGSEW